MDGGLDVFYLLVHPLNLFILGILFFVAIEAYFNRNKIPLAEYRHSIIYKIIHNRANLKFIFYPILLLLFVLFNFIFLTSYWGTYYPPYHLVLYDFFELLIIPILVLIFFDFLFLIIILPFVRTAIFNVHFYIEYLTRDNLFTNSRTLEEILKSKRKASEEYIFKIPLLNITDSDKLDTEYYLRRVARYIWTIRLGSHDSGLKEYIYLIVLVLIFLSFFLFFHSLYYKLIWQLDGKNIYILSFLIVWLIYVVMRLKTIIGSSYHYSQTKKEWKSKDIPSILNEVLIYKFTGENEVFLEREYTKDAIALDILHNKDSKNLDRIIEFSTTVVAAMIMQFIT